jgi:diacylglycerol kinase (ATP)
MIPLRSWSSKFVDAFRGWRDAMRDQSSFAIHFAAALAVIIAAAILRVDAIEWCLLAGCIAVVFVAELFNTALELLAKAITAEQHPAIRQALDVAAAAVLFAACGSAVIGAIVFGRRIWAFFAVLV